MTSQRTQSDNNSVLVYPPESSNPTGTTVSLSSFAGYDPTGVTSSQAAMTAAITAAGEWGTINVPAGIFRFTNPIVPKTGQKIIGAGIDVTYFKIDWASIANFSLGNALIQGVNTGATANHYVRVSGLTIDGSRSEATFSVQTTVPEGDGSSNVQTYAAGAQIPNRVYVPPTKTDYPGYAGPYPNDCPDGWGGGIALKTGWQVDNVRFVNINGLKASMFTAHGAVIRDCIWDNGVVNGVQATSGERDQIQGGGGVTDALIERCTFRASCIGSGLDFTQAQRLTVKDCRIYAASLIFEGVLDGNLEGNYVGPEGGFGGVGGGGNINIKPNTGYTSSEYNGALQPCGNRIVGNTVIGSANEPGISVLYADDMGKHPYSPPTTDFPAYLPGGDNLIEGNSIIKCKGGGIYIVVETGISETRAKNLPDIVRNNYVSSPVGPAKVGQQLAGIILSGGNKDKVYGNTIEQEAGADTCYGVGVKQSKATNPYIANNTTIGITTDVINY